MNEFSDPAHRNGGINNLHFSMGKNKKYPWKLIQNNREDYDNYLMLSQIKWCITDDTLF